MAEGVREKRESQLHCKPEGGGKVRFLRRGRGRALVSGLVDDLVVIEIHESIIHGEGVVKGRVWWGGRSVVVNHGKVDGESG